MLVTNFRAKNVLYRIVQAMFHLLDVAYVHPVRERELRALRRSVDYVEAKMPEALGFDTQLELIEYALAQLAVDGCYLEFGVYKGGTARFIAKRLPPGRKLHGFDSFEGLPEAWTGFDLARSTFSLHGKLPDVPANVELHKGWFSDILPVWCAAHPEPVAFAHIDCDVYSSTVDILAHIGPRFQPGTILLFDEYFNYPNWENHEFRAWQEYVTRYDIAYEYIGFARQQVAVRIVKGL